MTIKGSPTFISDFTTFFIQELYPVAKRGGHLTFEI